MRLLLCGQFYDFNVLKSLLTHLWTDSVGEDVLEGLVCFLGRVVFGVRVLEHLDVGLILDPLSNVLRECRES